MTSRLPDTSDEQFVSDPSLAYVQARVDDAGMQMGALYRALGNAPWLLKAWVDFAWELRSAPAAERAMRELAIMRVAYLTKADYEYVHHWKMAIEAGLSERHLTELGHWQQSDAYTDRERAVLTATDQLAQSAVLSDAAFDELSAHFQHAEVVELVLTLSFYCCVSRVLAGLGVQLKPNEGTEALAYLHADRD